MAYANHLKVTCSGSLGASYGSPEIFSYSFSLANPAGTEPSSGDYTDYNTVIQAFHGSTLLKISELAILEQIKYARIDTAGNTVGVPHYAYPDIPGDADGVLFPYQIAATISLNAASSTRRAKGRFYLPLPCWAWGSPGKWGDSDVDNALTAAVALVGGMNLVNTDRQFVVASGVDGNHPVTHVRVGNVPATIRRRRNQLVETYQSSIV